jgi:hypothetical protein
VLHVHHVGRRFFFIMVAGVANGTFELDGLLYENLRCARQASRTAQQYSLYQTLLAKRHIAVQILHATALSR